MSDKQSSMRGKRQANKNRNQTFQPEHAQQDGAAKSSAASNRAESKSMTTTVKRSDSPQELFSTLPVVDVQRVQELRSAIASGSFEFDPHRVADKLFAFEIRLPRWFL
jgi:flagellar biosynthesis anti-sigma factor FlgM